MPLGIPGVSDAVLTSHMLCLAVSLQMLYKLKTSKVFEKQKVGEGKQTAEIVEDDPFAIQAMSWCPESRIFCVAGVSAYVILYRFSKHEVITEIVVSAKSLFFYPPPPPQYNLT